MISLAVHINSIAVRFERNSLDGFKRNGFSGIAEGDVETVENGKSSQQIECHSQFVREPDDRFQLIAANADCHVVEVDGNHSAVSNRDRHFFSLSKIKTERFGIAASNNGEGSARIDVSEKVASSNGKFNFNGNDRSKAPMVGNVRETYRAHAKSFGRGIVKQVKTAFGCLARACSASWEGSLPIYTSSSTAMRYRPGYWSISRERFLHTQTESLTFFDFFLRVCMTKGL